jgi:hypothetical protein
VAEAEALPMTETELKVMAALAIIGFSSRPAAIPNFLKCDVRLCADVFPRFDPLAPA